MSDPPVNHDPPPFNGLDNRISPSGPYVPFAGAGGGFILFGADAVEQDLLELGDTALAFLPLPRTTSPAAPLAVTFPSWGSGNVLWISWEVSGIWSPGGPTDAAADLIVQPAITIDGTGPQLINPGEVISRPNFVTGGEGVLTQGFAISGTLALRLTNPAQPPVVQLYYSLAAAGDPPSGSNITIAGISPVEAAGSAWLCCAELDTTAAFQLPTIALDPVV